MNKLIRRALDFLDETQRHRIYRKLTALPSEFFNSDFRVEIARTPKDLESAYALLHDCYVGIRIMDPQPSGLRCNFHLLLPSSSLIIAKLHGQVIGTVCAILDSKAGLPSDQKFQNHNDHFRRQGKRLIEASALAVARHHRGDHCVSLLLMKFLYNYCQNYLRGDTLIGAVHPRSEDFYKALWHFQKNGERVFYNTLNNAEAIHMSMDLSKKHFEKVIRSYGGNSPRKNLGLMIVSPDERFHYPSPNLAGTISPAITPEILRYFCLDHDSIWERLDSSEREELIRAYCECYGADRMQEFRDLELLTA